MSSIHVHGMSSPIDISTTSNESCIALHWLPTTTTVTKIDPNQSKPLIQLLISIEQDSLRYDTGVSIDLTTPLILVSQKSPNRNDLVRQCPREKNVSS
jgi:hypothetical protein